MEALVLTVCSLALWLLSARAAYFIAAKRDWLNYTKLEGRASFSCKNYVKSWHSMEGGEPCEHCPNVKKVHKIESSHTARAWWSAFTGPFIVLGFVAAVVITAKQPLSASEQAYRLDKAEAALAQATHEMELLRKEG